MIVAKVEREDSEEKQKLENCDVYKREAVSSKVHEPWERSKVVFRYTGKELSPKSKEPSSVYFANDCCLR